MGKKRSMLLIQESLSDDEGIINYIYCYCKTTDVPISLWVRKLIEKELALLDNA